MFSGVHVDERLYPPCCFLPEATAENFLRVTHAEILNVRYTDPYAGQIRSSIHDLDLHCRYVRDLYGPHDLLHDFARGDVDGTALCARIFFRAVSV